MPKTRNFLAALALPLLAAAVTAPACAREVCGLTTFLDETMAGVKNKGYSAMCRAWEGCSIFSARAAGHRLQLARQDREKVWRVLLNTPPGAGADISEGVELIVDKGEPMRVPPEFLEERADGRAIIISPKLTEVVLPELQKGKLLKWRYTLKGGKQVEAEIPLEGFAPVLGWADCIKPKLDAAAEKKARGN